ncbi:hypothetical protein IKG07_01770, partial [Candidatus Saccharibacteria bacterium]|nr:hypothetical protein [Candidatus Saccharibacteria bacterium]
TYTQSSFTADKWGYKINSNTSIPSTITSGYVPFVSGNTLMESDTAVNHDEAELSLAAKIDYLQPSGSYSTTLNFNIVAHPLVDYIQDFTPTMCRTLASASDYTVVDKRDGNDYTVRWINGDCWMTQNLRFVGKTGDPAGTMTLDSTTSNVDTVYTPTNQLNITYTDIRTSPSFTDAMLYDSGDTTTGVWYNYAALSAMSVTGSSNTNEATQSLCPAGWRIPTTSEQSVLVDYATEFNPSVGGYWYNNTYNYPDYGFWPSSTASAAQNRYEVQYNSNNNTMRITQVGRATGEFIRCIRDDNRSLSDASVVNMQDINKQIVANTVDGTTKTLTDSRDGQSYTVKKMGGNLWMIDDLRFGINENNPNTTRLELHSVDSDVTTDRVLENVYDLATYGSSNCYGTYPSNPTGAGYTTPCMHSKDTTSGTLGVWYNYAAATVGTVMNAANATNTTESTESVCPKGWGLPSYTQTQAIAGQLSTFVPAYDGYYSSGTMTYNAAYGFWWTTTAYNNSMRYYLRAYLAGNQLASFENGSRHFGFQIRCIAK